MHHWFYPIPLIHLIRLNVSILEKLDCYLKRLGCIVKKEMQTTQETHMIDCSFKLISFCLVFFRFKFLGNQTPLLSFMGKLNCRLRPLEDLIDTHPCSLERDNLKRNTPIKVCNFQIYDE